jgi:hypothetical protein
MMNAKTVINKWYILLPVLVVLLNAAGCGKEG